MFIRGVGKVIRCLTTLMASSQSASCFDLSDECNDGCGREILENWVIRIISWILGILAFTFNAFASVRGYASIKESSTEQMMISRALISLISSGDFLIGLYLVILSVYDSLIFGEKFCEKQAEWLTGTPCLVLGIISTLGLQISLFTMTSLSIIRMYGLTCKAMTLPGPVNKRSILKVTSLGTTIITFALAIAFTPLAPSLEDYFVQGMYYNDQEYKVFIGFPNKERHINILQEYYNQSRAENPTNITADISWSAVGALVDGMFSKDYGNLTRSPVHFYGNDGICLFKYFVRTDDARRSRNSADTANDLSSFRKDPVVWTMLAVNFFCFAVITCCYIVICLAKRQSAQRSGQHDIPERMREERAFQRKIMIIIGTDFLCWVPFIIISASHDLGYIDASDWYASFAMIVLPLNSVINPLITDKAIVEHITRSFKRMKTAFSLLAIPAVAAINRRLRRSDDNREEDQPQIMELDNINANIICNISAHE